MSSTWRVSVGPAAWYVPCALPPEELKVQERWCSTTHDTVPLINEEVNAYDLIGSMPDGFRRRRALAELPLPPPIVTTAILARSRQRGSALFEKTLRDQERKSGIQVSSGFETPIKGVLDLFPQSPPIRSHDHAHPYRGIASSARRISWLPFGKNLRWRKFTFGHIVRLLRRYHSKR